MTSYVCEAALTGTKGSFLLVVKGQNKQIDGSDNKGL